MALVGDLKDLNIAAIIQLNCVEKNTAELMVSGRRSAARIYFGKGEIVHASYAGEKGEEALYKILSLSEGEFRVTPITELPERTIFTSWESLLLEGMRVIDETETSSIYKFKTDQPGVPLYGDVNVANKIS